MRSSTTAVPRRLLAGTVGLLLAAGALALVPGAARADSAPVLPSPENPVTVTADGLPTTQIDGVGWAQAIVGDTVYVGGRFSSARPAGVPAGTQESPRSNLLAYDIRTGALIASFAPEVNGQVLAVTASPDGSRLYIGGDFTAVDGQTRNRVAAFDTATGALVASFAPSVNSQVRAIAATNSTVYLGGSLTAVGGVSRTRLAAVSAADGSLLSWAPLPGVGPVEGNRDGNTATSNEVMALTLTGGGSQVVAAGRFDSMNGVKATGISALDAVSGATRPFAVNALITNQGVNSGVYSLSTDGAVVYASAYDFNGPGNMEGTVAATADGGEVVAVNDCHGDTYSTFPMGGALYMAGHAHDCEQIGGFPEQNPRVNKFATAVTTGATGGTNGPGTLRSGAFYGQPAPSLLDWFPTMNAGTVTGQLQAGWSVTGNGRYLVFAGEFPRVNGVEQQGLVRYAFAADAPNAVGPTPTGFTAGAVTTAPGTASISFRATHDQDNEWLTYRVYRDTESPATLVAETTRASTWWSRPLVTVTDPAATETSRYRVVATDPFGNRAVTPWASIDPAGVPATQGYRQTVAADGAYELWPLGETPEQLAASGNLTAGANGLVPLLAGAGVTAGVPGAISGDAGTAFGLSGEPGGMLVIPTLFPALDTLSVEAWFRTDSDAGGLIAGFGDSMTGRSTVVDRLTYLQPDGRAVFGVSPEAGVQRTVTSEESYNDGEWHHVISSMSPSGLFLYVDGELVGSRTDTRNGLDRTSYFRVGGDTTWGSGSYLEGDVDEVAFYISATTAERAARHFEVGHTGAEPNAAPRPAFTTATAGLGLAVDGTLSRDPDGTVASHSWNWGDGTPAGSGAQATHTYAAAGTYTVTLTVTDDHGRTATAVREVTVSPANAAPTAAFTAAADGLAVAVDGRTSADADGTVASYSWNWGDGTPAGSGAQATHTYAAAGTYTVTLTVTDDDGATATATQPVPVTTGPAVLAADAWNRTVTGGLGTADTGGAWTPSAGAARLSVAPGAATLALPSAGNNTGAYLGGVSRSDVDLRTSFTLTAAPAGGGTYVYLSGRRVGSDLDYRVRVRIAADRSVALVLSRISGGTEGYPGGEVVVPGLTWTPGTPLEVGVQVTGTGTTEIRAWIWAAGTAQPATPQLSRTDTTAALQVPGAVGLSAYRTSSNTTATAVRFGALTVTGPGGGAPPVNQAPTAAFATAVTGLSVAVDGRISTDPDGTVAGYAWNWGDGTAAGSGAQATHTYAAAGTYPVTLTVTDDGGATATRVEQVTVVATTPPPAGVLASDAFGRTVAGGLGTADVGGPWTASAGAARQSVAPGTAALAVNPGQNTGSYLGGVSSTATDVRTTLTVSQVPSGGSGVSVYVLGRRVAASLDYSARLQVRADGTVVLALLRTGASGSETLLGTTANLAGTYTPGTPLQVRLQVSGTGTTTLALTVWTGTGPEPATPTLTRTDATAALQVPGAVGLSTYLSASATGPVTVRATSFVAAPVGAGTPVNQPPTAAFTATPTGLAVAVDGRASADPDGTVAAHSWTWGDGTAAGSGAQATHTYAAAGTYAVTLTVTDDRGRTASTTQQVTVTAPGGQPQPAVLASDAFGRSVTGGLGTADVGGAWTASAGAARQSVAPGTATLTVGPGNNTGSYLGAVAQRDVDVRATLSLSAVPTSGSGAFVYVVGRRVDAATDYRARLLVVPGGGVQVALVRNSGGTETVLGSATLPAFTYTAGTPLEVRLRVTGTGPTSLAVTVWRAGTAEPATPTLTRSDSTAALQVPGAVGVAAYLSGSATGPVAVRLTGFTVTAG
ncbi:PKD domain-containing protein [Blastococcus sp. SYSU D00820]